MAMRPIWKGSISFGLVNIPVSIYLAARSERVGFKMLHAPDQGRIHYKRVCEVDGEEVPWEEIVKGYEYAKGRYVEITDEDLESIDIGLARTVDIVQFVDQEEIDPVFYDKPYFLEPTKGAERAYALLREALVRSGKVGIARVVFREREYLAAVRPRGEALALDTMRFATELRDQGELHLPAGAATELPEKQIDLALMLVEQLTAPWDPDKYADRYQEAVQRMIDRKLEGLPLPAAAPAPATGEVIDLAEILRRSLEQARPGGGEAEERPAKGQRRAAAAAQAARSARRKEKEATPEEKPARKRSASRSRKK
ncbi:Ku protein [Vulgatibacter sp.]|uniref:non-homologous end joining protein Ku n=1 Tax=Vulgatibacter sp. TaxID=1971226 RepID=UPI003561A3FE